MTTNITEELASPALAGGQFVQLAAHPTVSDTDVIDALERAVRARGADFVYQYPDGMKCLYTQEDGSPGCLVGFVLAEVAPQALKGLHEEEWLKEAPYHLGGNMRWGHPSGGISYLSRDTLHSLFSTDVVAGLAVAQIRQDAGGTWSEAVAAFMSSYARNKAAEAAGLQLVG